MILWFLFTYILGGLTFIPLVLLAIFYHAYKTQPVIDTAQLDASSRLLNPVEEEESREDLKKVPVQTSQSHDGIALFFAVCREYVTGGVDVKPERMNGHAPSAHNESPSVYQSMYRSIFERGKTQSPSLESASHKSKKPRNIFFVVIRLGLLMLYDDEEQVEVRHVISLENYDVDIYGGGEDLLDGELWVKRNCIRLVRRVKDEETLTDSKPFYLFSNHCSKKEDFYHAMLMHQSRRQTSELHPLMFESEHMMKLFRQLHSSEDNLQTRWINALIGRVFLALYKTSLAEQLIRMKVNKKLSRVVKPAFISAVQIRNISLGDSAPSITGPKLRELTQEGDLTIEMDVRYKGNARIDVAAIARIDLGTRFKAREVEIVLAVILKSLEGHLLIRIKPPPSNRIWFSFETNPKVDLSIEPIISSRQITYGLILRAIDSRIREVVNETLVYPNWDDIPFFDTFDHDIRGGIWQGDSADSVNEALSSAPTLVEGGEAVPMQDGDPAEAAKCAPASTLGEISQKIAAEKPARRRHKKTSSITQSLNDDTAVSSSADVAPSPVPRAMRSHSFASAAIPIVTKDPASTHSTSELSRSAESDAATNLSRFSSRSRPGTPTESPVGSPQQHGLWKRNAGSNSFSSKRSGSDAEPVVVVENASIDGTTADNIAKTLLDDGEAFTAEPLSLHKRQTIASTAAAARKWGLGLIAKNHSPSSSISGVGTMAEEDSDNKVEPKSGKMGALKAMKESLEAGTSSIAYGRGKPLPPIGTPLPGPGNNRKTWTAPLSLLGRKKNGADLGFTPQQSPNAASVYSNSDSADSQSMNESIMEGEKPPKLPPRSTVENTNNSLEDLSKGSNIPRAIKSRQSSRRQRLSDAHAAQHGDAQDSILIIAAPEGDTDHDSESLSSPTSVHLEVAQSTDGFIDSVVEDYAVKAVEDDASSIHSHLRNDTQDATSGQAIGTTPKVKALRIARKPISAKASASSLSLAEATDWATSSSTLQESSTLSSPMAQSMHTIPADSPVSFDAGAPDQTVRVRKARSRQSLIPTPTSSRRASPVNDVGPPVQPMKAGRRTSTQSLQELSRSESRRSNGLA